MARPMPRPPPVTIATRPERLICTVPFVGAPIRATGSALLMPPPDWSGPPPLGEGPAAFVCPLSKVGQRRDGRLLYEEEPRRPHLRSPDASSWRKTVAPSGCSPTPPRRDADPPRWATSSRSP